MLLPINIGGHIFLLPIKTDSEKKNEKMIDDKYSKIGIKEIIFNILLGIAIIGIIILFVFVIISI